MSAEIFYFSGTGNSLHIAKELRKRLPSTNLTSILSLASEETVKTSTETVGFVFPQYASTTPKIVEAFMRKLDLEATNYTFVVITRGRTNSYAFNEVNKILGKKGRSLDAFFVMTMPSGSSPLLQNFTVEMTEEKISEIEVKAQNRLDLIQRIIVNKESIRDEDVDGVKPPPSYLLPFTPIIDFLVPFLIPLGKHAESSFEFYSDSKCTGCGLCETVCLSNKIIMSENSPHWQNEKQCIGCFACINYCPQESIQIKSKWYLKSYTEKNGRYHHPDVTAEEIARQKKVWVN